MNLLNYSSPILEITSVVLVLMMIMIMLLHKIP